MADIVFVVEKRTGKKAEGRLQWPAWRLDSPAISGPHGKGALPNGAYTLRKDKLLDKPAGSSYCDPKGNCWMQPADPDFKTDRNNLGIHPDGGAVGTEGCIGLQDQDTKPWFDAFKKVPPKTGTSLEVRDAE